MRGISIFAAISIAFAGGILAPARVAAAVPDNGRAWELVTPAEPMTARLAAPAPPNPTGNGITYVTFGPMPGAPSGSLLSYGVAVRGQQGWTSSTVGFPYSGLVPEVFGRIFPFLPTGSFEGGSTSLWLSVIPLSSDSLPEGDAGLYRRAADNTFTLIADVGEMPNPLVYPGYVEQPKDGEHAVFDTAEHLLPTDAGRTEGRSIYDSVGATLKQVDVADDGTPLSSCGSDISHNNGVSSSGERIFFTNPASTTSCPGPSEVYLREGDSKTIPIAASQCTRLDCNDPADVSFVGATPSGEDVFITTTQQLTNDDVDVSRDLYRYDVIDGNLTLLSGGSTSPETTVVEHAIVHCADDGSYVYFYAYEDGISEREGLYLADPAGVHRIADASSQVYEEYEEEAIQLSGNGHIALFQTSFPGEEGDTDGRGDVYLYNADSDALTRLSSGPSGGNGGFEATILTTKIEQEPTRVGRQLIYRSLSESGQDAFFTTPEQLVPEDVNQAIDVYEWKKGQVGLVSSGTGKAEVVYGGASADGGTVFFQTGQTLVPSDRDGGDVDLYAARIGGGFVEAAPPSSEGCAASPCDLSPRARVVRPVPASATYHARRVDGRLRFLRVISTGAAGDMDGERVVLLVHAPSPGRVSAVGTGLGHGARVTLRGSAGAVRAGRVRIALRPSESLSRLLGQENRVKVHLVIREGTSRLARTISLGSAGQR